MVIGDGLSHNRSGIVAPRVTAIGRSADVCLDEAGPSAAPDRCGPQIVTSRAVRYITPAPTAKPRRLAPVTSGSS